MDPSVTQKHRKKIQENSIETNKNLIKPGKTRWNRAFVNLVFVSTRNSPGMGGGANLSFGSLMVYSLLRNPATTLFALGTAPGRREKKVMIFLRGIFSTPRTEDQSDRRRDDIWNWTRLGWPSFEENRTTRAGAEPSRAHLHFLFFHFLFVPSCSAALLLFSSPPPGGPVAPPVHRGRGPSSFTEFCCCCFCCRCCCCCCCCSLFLFLSRPVPSWRGVFVFVVVGSVGHLHFYQGGGIPGHFKEPCPPPSPRFQSFPLPCFSWFIWFIFFVVKDQSTWFVVRLEIGFLPLNYIELSTHSSWGDESSRPFSWITCSSSQSSRVKLIKLTEIEFN